MFRTQVSTLAQIALNAAAIGVRSYANMVNAVRSQRVVFRARAQAVVAGGITSVRNRGSAWALFDAVGIEENGVDVVNLDARLLRFFTEMHAPSAMSSARMALANATYQLEETSIIHLAHPLAANPNETAFVEADPRQALRAFVIYNGNAANQLGAIGAGTITVSNVSVTLQQWYDDKRGNKPLLLPYYRQITQQVVGAMAATPFYLKTSRYVRALAIQQDTTGAGEVNDIITSFTLRGDLRDLIGPQPELWDDAIYSSEADFGGNVAGGGGLITAAQVPVECYLGINFQRNGRLSQIVNPARDVNLRLELTGQASVTTGATASFVRVGLLELQEVAGLTVPAQERGFDI